MVVCRLLMQGKVRLYVCICTDVLQFLHSKCCFGGPYQTLTGWIDALNARWDFVPCYKVQIPRPLVLGGDKNEIWGLQSAKKKIYLVLYLTYRKAQHDSE